MNHALFMCIPVLLVGTKRRPLDFLMIFGHFHCFISVSAILTELIKAGLLLSPIYRIKSVAHVEEFARKIDRSSIGTCRGVHEGNNRTSASLQYMSSPVLVSRSGTSWIGQDLSEVGWLVSSLGILCGCPLCSIRKQSEMFKNMFGMLCLPTGNILNSFSFYAKSRYRDKPKPYPVVYPVGYLEK